MLKIEGLTPLEQYRLRVAHKPEITEDEISPGLVCFSVMKGIGNAETYDDMWTREARGITFYSYDGSVASRPFHKFFNVNERETTLVRNLDWSKVTRVMDKRDGSMIHPVMIGGKVRMKSKKTFESDVALAATQFISDRREYQIFCRNMADLKATPIFEWTSPAQRIVLGYAEPELKLLHVRDLLTGEYWPLSRVKAAASNCKIPVVDEVTEFNSFDEMLEAAKTREEIEGWVIQFDSGEMVKVKTDWYMARHRAMTNYRERDVVEDILNEKLDDVKSALASAGIDIEPILAIEKRFAADMAEIIQWTKDYYEAHKEMEARQVAARFKEHPYFGLVMAMYNKKEPKYKDFFLRNVFKQKYGLDSIARLMSAPTQENDDE